MQINSEKSEKIEPKHIRFLGCLSLLGLLPLFVMLLLASGTVKSQVVKIPESKIQLSQGRRKPKANQETKKRNKMSATIIAGTSGPATETDYECPGGDGPVQWYVYTSPGGGVVAHLSSPGGWSVGTDGTITVPTGATPGNYYAISEPGIIDPSCGSYPYTRFDFTVVTGYTRYHCVSGSCVSYLAATNTEGYASAEACSAAGCFVGVDRWFCENCAVGVSDQDPDGPGYASAEECAAACPPVGGWWVCNPTTGVCTQDPGASSGSASHSECVGACIAPCTTAFTLTVEPIDIYGHVRIIAHITGSTHSTPPTTFVGATSGSIAVDSYDSGIEGPDIQRAFSAPITTHDVAELFTVTVSDSGCDPISHTISVGGCALAVSLGSEDLGGGNYRVTATCSGVTGSATAVFTLAGSPSANETPFSTLCSIPAGETKTVGVIVEDEACERSATITITNSDEPDGPGDDCCEPGFYRETEGGDCLPIPVIAAPGIPAAPTVAKSCADGKISITAPAFPAGAYWLDLQREGDTDPLHTFDAPGSFDDTVPGLLSRRYRVRACNGIGCSAYGAWSAAVTLVSDDTIAFDNLVADQMVQSLDIITVLVSGTVPLAAENPVRISFAGTDLSGVTQSPGDPHQYFVALPPEFGDWQGPIVLQAQATDSGGCQSLVASITVQINSSLLGDTRWGDVRVTSTSPIDSLQVDAAIEGGSDGNYTYEFAFASPPPTLSPPPTTPTADDQAALEADWALMQRAPLFADEPLLGRRQGDGSYLAPTGTAICRIRAARKWKLTRYALLAPVVKSRPTAPGEFLFYAFPYIYRFDGTGWNMIQDLSAFALGAAVDDGIVRGGKILAVSNSKAYSLDADAFTADDDGADVSNLDTPLAETRAAKFIENLVAEDSSNGVASWVRVYGDTAGCALYESWVGVDGTETRRRWQLAHPMARCVARGPHVVFTAGTDATLLYTWKRGLSAPVLRHTHATGVGITFCRFLEPDSGVSEDILFGDANGTLYVLGADDAVPLQLADFSFPVRDGCQFQGDREELRTITGGDDPHVYFEGDSGVLIPLITLATGEHVTAVERFVQIVVPAVGNLLLGGTPAVTIDNLLVAVTSSSGSHLLRYQSRERAPLALDGDGIGNIELSISQEQVVTVLPTT